MFVTREVSQLSGWLKAVASCRGAQAGHTVRGGLWAGRRQAASDFAVCARSMQWASRAGREAERGERLRCVRSTCRGEGAYDS